MIMTQLICTAPIHNTSHTAHPSPAAHSPAVQDIHQIPLTSPFPLTFLKLTTRPSVQSSSPPISLTLPPQGIHQFPLTSSWVGIGDVHQIPLPQIPLLSSHQLHQFFNPTHTTPNHLKPPTNTTQNSPIPLTLSSSIYFTNNSTVPINTAISTNFTHSADPKHSCIKLHSFHQLHLLY